MRSNVLLRLTYLFLISTALLFITNSSAFATSWVKLTPTEIINKAEIIVEGTYIISEDQSDWDQKGMWVPFQFEVVKYYRGEGKQYIKAAIEQFDVGWAKEFQDKGGRFVLFLNNDKEEFWIPVAGPNGMIQVLDGDIQNQSAEDSKAVDDFLSNQAHSKPQTGGKEEENFRNSTALWMIGLPIFTLALLAFKWLRDRRAK